MNCSVHRYKWSQSDRRKKLKHLTKLGHLKYLGRSKTHYNYQIINMEEYRKRK